MKHTSSDSKYISLRMPKVEYDKIKQVRDQLKEDPKYSWVENLALGAFIGLMAGLVIEDILASKKKLR